MYNVEDRELGDFYLLCMICNFGVSSRDLYEDELPPRTTRAVECLSCERHVIHVKCMTEEQMVELALN